MQTIAIIGAGGIGCYYGARLLNAGHKVVFVARGEHLKALQEVGLAMNHPEFRFDQPVEALSQQQFFLQTDPEQFDLVILTLKAMGTHPLLGELESWLGQSSTPLLSLQNGVDNELQLAQQLGSKRVLGGLAVRIGAHIVGPGEVEAVGVAQIILGQWPSADTGGNQNQRILADIDRAFNDTGIPTEVVADIQKELWRKLVINNGVNPLSAVTGLDTRTLSHHPDFEKIVYGLMAEAAKSAEGDGIQLTQQDVDEMYQLIRQFDAIKTSMLVDKEKGRPLEVDEICGAVLQRSSDIGVAAPYTETVMSMLKHLLDQKKE
ncbi:MAG: ketopantoate reductase family protein [Proteobacteria bacterium]|nr:ketopantoate reductase family protein [Pseudomonadota bacterium]